jgi:hypothetical protein
MGVVPAWALTGMLEEEPFVSARKTTWNKILKEHEKNPPGAVRDYGGSAPAAASDENPNHQEDFMRLLGETAPTRKSED